MFSPFFSQEDRFVIGLHAKRVAQKQFTHVGIVKYQLPGVNPGEMVKPPTAVGKLFPNVKVHQCILALIHSKQFIKFFAPDLNAKNLKYKKNALLF